MAASSGREQRGRAFKLVVVGAPLRDARQDWLGAVAGLDLALFVDREHQRTRQGRTP